MAQILTILPVGIENLKKLVWNVRILRSSGQRSVNWADFAQFAVNFESSIYHGVNWKMALRIFTLFVRMVGFLVTWGVYVDF